MDKTQEQALSQHQIVTLKIIDRELAKVEDVSTITYINDGTVEYQ